MREFTHYGPWLRSVVGYAADQLIRDSEQTLLNYFRYEADLPSTYSWRFTSAEAFSRQIKAVKFPDELNKFYWHDMAGNLEAYDVFTAWRVSELLAAEVELLNRKAVLSAATIARSLLELGATGIWNANVISGTIDNIVKAKQKIMISTELEEILLKMIHGTRLSDQPAELKQKNIITYIQHVAKHPDAAGVWPTYEFLCEVAHPNVIGNARFWSNIESVNADGSEIRKLEREGDTAVARQITEKAIWATAWSAICIRNALEMNQSTVRQMLDI